MKKIKLEYIKHIHFTGIKGVGMTALALCSRDLGIQVTGSDTGELFVTDEALSKRKIEWTEGFNGENISKDIDLVVTTGAHGGLGNIEVVKAKKLGISVMSYAEALALFSDYKKLISVCGVGGKGTTSSIVAVLLNEAAVDTSFAIGMGNILPLGVSGKYNLKSDFFVCEADEYAISPGINNNPKFSLLNPYITVVTNVEHDHPDIYPTFNDTVKVYKQYFNRIPKNGLLVANIDNPNTKKIIQNLKVPLTTYGYSKNADWRVGNVIFKEEKTVFKLTNQDNNEYTITVNLPGIFNVLNTTAAFIVSQRVGLSAEKAIKAISKYVGARRRFEKMGEKKGVIYYDDYAHHPGEIKSVISAAKTWYPKRRIVAIFQPHTFSRTKTLFKEFSKAFSGADVAGFMDIYASARETKDDSVSSKELAIETKKHNKNSLYLGDHKKTLQWIKNNVVKGDVVLTLGAGDIFHMYNLLKLRNKK